MGDDAARCDRAGLARGGRTVELELHVPGVRARSRRGRDHAEVLQQPAEVTQDRVRDDLELLLAVFPEIERRIELPERAHRLFAELEELLDLPPDATIRDRGEEPGQGRVLGCFGH